MSKLHRVALVKRADLLIEKAVEDARASGKLDRRSFMRMGTLSLGAAMLSACNSQGPKWADRWLKYAEKKNEIIERWMFSHKSINKGSPKAYLAGDYFPSYFVSDTLPIWDTAKRGVWRVKIGGAVKKPVELSLQDLMSYTTARQRVDHFCVEGWTATAILSGVPMTRIARLVEPTPDANYVDFASFDKDYHESWDIESAMHPQTIIAIAKEDAFLPPEYGAPARVHSPAKLGYKNTKYLTNITFMPKRNGGYWSDLGYEWYGGT